MDHLGVTVYKAVYVVDHNSQSIVQFYCSLDESANETVSLCAS